MTWYINVIVQEPPEPVFDRKQTYLTISGKKASPGHYTVKKGSTIYFNFRVQNKGGAGTIRVVLNAGNNIYDKTFSVSKMSIVSDSGYFNVYNDVAVRFYAYAWDGKAWKMTDEYG